MFARVKFSHYNLNIYTHMNSWLTGPKQYEKKGQNHHRQMVVLYFLILIFIFNINYLFIHTSYHCIPSIDVIYTITFDQHMNTTTTKKKKNLFRKSYLNCTQTHKKHQLFCLLLVHVYYMCTLNTRTLVSHFGFCRISIEF